MFHSVKKIAIIGYGGFAREISCNLKKNSYDFFINKDFIDKTNISIVKPLEEIDISKYKILVAIGDPFIRKKIIDSFSKDTEYYTYIDKYSKILDKETVNIGKGSIIAAGSILTTNIKIGEFVHLNLNTTVGHDSIIKDYVTTTPGVHISGETNIGNCCYFGCGSVIKNKVTICDDIIVGMNGVVNKNITEKGIYVGVPVKKIKN
jgi:sugar O-acyltransferase (sialic acid O-acetyltransferase NeuD family)